QSALRLGVLDHGIGRGLQLGEIEAAVAQLELHGEAAGIADALDRRRREHPNARLLDRGEVAVELLEQRPQDLALASLAPILEHDISAAGIASVELLSSADTPEIAITLATAGFFPAISLT